MGTLFTYDADKLNYFDKSHLNWAWNCSQIINNSFHVNCNHLLSNLNGSVTQINYHQFNFYSNTFYSFRVNVKVMDNEKSLTRNACYDLVNINFNVIPNSNNIIKTLLISLTAIKTSININENLRIIGNIENYDNVTYFEYIWDELNNLIDKNELNEYKTSINNSNSLALKKNVLQQGQSYTFRLTVNEYNDETKSQLIGNGFSTLLIYVKKWTNNYKKFIYN